MHALFTQRRYLIPFRSLLLPHIFTDTLVIGAGGASLPEAILLKRLFYWPLMLAFLGVIFSMAVIGGFSFNLFLS